MHQKYIYYSLTEFVFFKNKSSPEAWIDPDYHMAPHHVPIRPEGESCLFNERIPDGSAIRPTQRASRLFPSVWDFGASTKIWANARQPSKSNFRVNVNRSRHAIGQVKHLDSPFK